MFLQTQSYLLYIELDFLQEKKGTGFLAGDVNIYSKERGRVRIFGSKRGRERGDHMLHKVGILSHL